jgi:hypothetical protein
MCVKMAAPARRGAVQPSGNRAPAWTAGRKELRERPPVMQGRRDGLRR